MGTLGGLGRMALGFHQRSQDGEVPGLVGWVGACCPGLVALPEKGSRVRAQPGRHLGPWVGRPQQPSHGRAESGHMGAAEG